MSDLGISVICADNPTQFTDPSPTALLVRQMMGSVYTFVASQIRDRMSKGYNKAKATAAADPSGRRSYDGSPKLGGRDNLLDLDPELHSTMKGIAKRKSINLGAIALELQVANESWCVQHGPRKGQPWSAKQIGFFLKRFRSK